MPPHKTAYKSVIKTIRSVKSAAFIHLKKHFKPSVSFLTAVLFSFSVTLTLAPDVAFAAAQVDAPQTAPASFVQGTPTEVLITSRIDAESDGRPLYTNVVLLQRVGPNNSSFTNLGLMYDDGTHGDQTANDYVFTTQLVIDPGQDNTVNLRVLAAYYGLLRRIPSDVTEIPVIPDAVNEPPEFTSQPLTEAIEDHLYYYQAQAQDPEGGQVTLELMEGPKDLTMTDSGFVQWTPRTLQVGPQSVLIKATDPQGETAMQPFTIDVAPYNYPPVFTSQPQRQVNANEEYIYDAEAYDKENMTITFSLDEAPQGMTINSATGEISWTPDGSSEDSANIVVRATDEDGAFATQSFPIYVITEQLNLISPSGEYQVTAGETLELTLEANYTGAGFRVTPLPENATLPFNSNVFKFTPTKEQAGTYNLGFEAVFAKMRDINPVLITVVSLNTPPVLDAFQAQAVGEGQELRVPVSASDADNDTLHFFLPGLDVDNVYFDEISSEVVFMPDFDQAGNYEILIRVSDGTDADEKLLPIEVLNVEEDNYDTLDLVVDDLQNPNFRTKLPISGSVMGEVRRQEYAPPVLITGLSPSSIYQGREATIDITGLNTHFDASTTTINFGSGITVDNFEVLSETTARAAISSDVTADTGSRQVVIRQGSDEVLSAVAFNILESASRINGVLIDSFTKQPVAGARVGVNGTLVVDHTESDGSFSLDGLPGGESAVVITVPNYEVVNFKIALDNNAPLDLGEIEIRALARPFDAGGSIPRGPTIASVIDRGISTRDMKLSLEQAKALITDALISLPGSEFGVYDEAGNQLNTQTQGPGAFSLTPQGVSQHASALLEGNIYTLEDILDMLYGSFAWIFGDRFNKREMLAALQNAVNRAWASPGDPYNGLPIMIFNDGNTLLSNPPELTMSTPLNHFQAYLLITSFMANFAPTINYAFGQLYELNGLEAPSVELDLDTLERVVTIQGQEYRSGEPSFAQGDFGQPVQLAAAGISNYLLGDTVYAEDADPNESNSRPDSTSERTWGEIAFSEVINFGTAFALSIAFIGLSVIVLGWLGLGAGLAGLTVAGFLGAALLTTAIGYGASLIARGAGAYFAPQAVQSLTPPPPGGIRHRQSADVKKVYIQFQKDFRHTQRDNEIGPGEPLFPRLTTLVDLFGPGVNLALVEFEYQLWKVKGIRTEITDREDVQLISTNATPVSSRNVAGGVEREDFLEFVIPIERLNQGDNYFKIRTVMFYRGHLLFESDPVRSSNITLEELGIKPPPPPFDPGYKDAITLSSTGLSVSESAVNATLTEIDDTIKVYEFQLGQLNEEPINPDDYTKLEGLKGRQKIWEDYLDKETKNLAEIQKNEFTAVERLRGERYGATRMRVERYMSQGGDISHVLDPNHPIGQTIVEAAGGQAEFDNIKPEIEELARVHDDFNKGTRSLRSRTGKIWNIDNQKFRLEEAYIQARRNNAPVSLSIEYELLDLPTSDNPAPTPKKVIKNFSVQPDGIVLNTDDGSGRGIQAELATLEDHITSQNRDLEQVKKNHKLNSDRQKTASKKLQEKFLTQERVDEMNRKIETSKDKIKRITEARDQHKSEIQRTKQKIQADAAERTATRTRVEGIEAEIENLAEMELKTNKSVFTKLANERVVRALNSNTGQGILTAATVVADSAWEIREGIKMLPSKFSAPYVLTRNGDQVSQFGPSSPPVPPTFGPGPSGSGGSESGGPLPRTRTVFKEAFENLNIFSMPMAFAQVPSAVYPPFFETDPDSSHLLGFLRTLANSENPKAGYLARQYPFTSPESNIVSAGFPADYIATDSTGAVYLINGNSYSNYGGRIFRFSGDPAFREHIGVMNYYSQLLGVTRAVRPIAMEVAEFKDDTYDFVENLFIANREDGIPLLSGGAPPPNRILRVPVHLADLHPAYADGQNRNRIVGQPYVTHPDFKFTGPSDMERDVRPRENDTDPPRPFYFSDEENIFAIRQIEDELKGEAIKIVSVPGRRWSGLAQDVNGNFFFADYNRGEVFLLAAEDLDALVDGGSPIISDGQLDNQAYLIKVGINSPGDIELDSQQERYVVSTPNGFEAFDLVLIGRYSSNILSMATDVLDQPAPVTLRAGRGNVFIVGKPTEGDNVRRVRLKIKRRNSETGQTYWSEEAMHLNEFGATIYDGTLS